MRLVHHCPGLDREVAATVRAPIGHVVMAGLVGVCAPTVGAMPTAWPDTGLKPLARASLGGKHVAKLP